MAPPEIPQIHSQPLDDWIEDRLLAALQRHSLWCLQHGVGADVGRLKLRFAMLVGFMVGSGLLGGAAGALLAKAIGG